MATIGKVNHSDRSELARYKPWISRRSKFANTISTGKSLLLSIAVVIAANTSGSLVTRNTYDFVRTKFKGAKQAPELKGEFRLLVPLISGENGSEASRSFDMPDVDFSADGPRARRVSDVAKLFPKLNAT